MGVKKALFVSIVTVIMAFTAVSCMGSKTASTEGGQSASGRQAKGRADKQQEDAIDTTDPTDELNSLRISLMGLNIPCGIGFGEAATEQEAHRTAAEEAKTKTVEALEVQLKRFGDTYAGNVPPKDRKTWKETAGKMGAERVSAYKTFTRRNRETGSFKVYTMMILDPVEFKKAVVDAASINQEFTKRSKKDLIISTLDAFIADFNSKYRIE